MLVHLTWQHPPETPPCRSSGLPTQCKPSKGRSVTSSLHRSLTFGNFSGYPQPDDGHGSFNHDAITRQAC